MALICLRHVDRGLDRYHSVCRVARFAPRLCLMLVSLPDCFSFCFVCCGAPCCQAHVNCHFAYQPCLDMAAHPMESILPILCPRTRLWLTCRLDRCRFLASCTCHADMLCQLHGAILFGSTAIPVPPVSDPLAPAMLAPATLALPTLALPPRPRLPLPRLCL